MTQIKSISIPDDEDCFVKLNEITPNNMSISKQVRIAVRAFVEMNDADAFKYIKEKMPEYTAPIEDWIDYIRNHPEHVREIMDRHIQLGNILSRETYVIQ